MSISHVVESLKPIYIVCDCDIGAGGRVQIGLGKNGELVIPSRDLLQMLIGKVGCAAEKRKY
jgi:hypothetical protein